ncbi:hypothetical protein D6D21_08047 [Aureobasidium pullulans]|uniref:Uncharacterized protein n=1 Tax=Aureobasidium pullulans TaxID=5580 RepID=A0AB74IQ30_AURPU|nr:hypothetical protein D6D21_08047 [Aureobasidium pullulans]THX45086.1 hypothetical protein D6D08_10461 [Aureobasidium pullulans]
MNPLLGSDQGPMWQHYIQLPREKKARQDSAAQNIAETKGKHLAAALAQAEEEDFEAADDGERSARVEAMMSLAPLLYIAHDSSRNPVSILKTHISKSTPSKRVHFLTLETLVQHTSIHLAHYNDKRSSGPVLSMSFVLLHASFSSSPRNSANLQLQSVLLNRQLSFVNKLS